MLNAFKTHASKFAFMAGAVVGGASILAIQKSEKPSLNYVQPKSQDYKMDFVELKTGKMIHRDKLNEIIHQLTDLDCRNENLYQELLKKSHNEKYKLDGNIECALTDLGWLDNNGIVNPYVRHVFLSINPECNTWDNSLRENNPTKEKDFVADFDVELHNGSKVSNVVVRRVRGLIDPAVIEDANSDKIYLSLYNLKMKCQLGFYPLPFDKHAEAVRSEINPKDDSINNDVCNIVISAMDNKRRVPRNPIKRGPGKLTV